MALFDLGSYLGAQGRSRTNDQDWNPILEAELRWRSAPICPKSGCHSFLQPKDSPERLRARTLVQAVAGVEDDCLE